MISATLTSFILNSFEATLAIIPTLTIFIPMLLNTAGNSGGQSSTLIVRALAIGEIHTYDYFQIIKKEMGVALIAGAALATFNFIWIIVQIQIGFINISSDVQGWLIALLVSATLFTTIFIAKSIGASLPIIAKKVGLDPALMAGPLVSTIVDSVSLMVYFLLATQLFSLI
jgi:magnesium transporter